MKISTLLVPSYAIGAWALTILEPSVGSLIDVGHLDRRWDSALLEKRARPKRTRNDQRPTPTESSPRVTRDGHQVYVNDRNEIQGNMNSDPNDPYSHASNMFAISPTCPFWSSPA